MHHQESVVGLEVALVNDLRVRDRLLSLVLLGIFYIFYCVHCVLVSVYCGLLVIEVSLYVVFRLFTIVITITTITITVAIATKLCVLIPIPLVLLELCRANNSDGREWLFVRESRLVLVHLDLKLELLFFISLFGFATLSPRSALSDI